MPAERRKAIITNMLYIPGKRPPHAAALGRLDVPHGFADSNGETDMVDCHGRFLWYELTTTHMEAAKAFYAKVVGWGTQDASMPGMPYTLFTAGGVFVSGMMTLPPDASTVGARPRWIGYVGVDDVDATADRLQRLGGVVQVPPTDVPNISRFSIATDPQMATIALFKWLNPAQGQPAAPGTRGGVGWHELFTADCEQAWAFYRELFGWQKGVADSGAMGTYQLFAAGGQTIGGIFTKPPTVPVPFWLYYFNVADIDAAAARVQANGGQILNGPTEVPDGSWIVHCTDPQDALFALVGKRSYHAVGLLERLASSE
ncbi:MAG TPA: VOC family protein [Xanthobacteraceae bacterium]